MTPGILKDFFFFFITKIREGWLWLVDSLNVRQKSYLCTPQYACFQRASVRPSLIEKFDFQMKQLKRCCLILGSHHCQSVVRTMQFAVFTFHDWIQIPLLFTLGQSLVMTCLYLKGNISSPLTAYWLKQIQWLWFKVFVNFNATWSRFVSKWNILTWCITAMNWDRKGFLHPWS